MKELYLPNAASKQFNSLREHLDYLVRKEREIAIKEYAESGQDVREFKTPQDLLKDSFYNLFNQFRERKKKERRTKDRIEVVKKESV